MLYSREYSALFQALNQHQTDSYLNISREEYGNGKTIFPFNFAPDLTDGCGVIGHVIPIINGALQIAVRFNKGLENPVNVIAFCEFDNIVEITADGVISSNGLNAN